MDPVSIDDSSQTHPNPNDASTGQIPSDEDDVDTADSSSPPLQADHDGNPTNPSFQPFLASSLPHLGDQVGPVDSSLQNDAGLGQVNPPSLPSAKSSVVAGDIIPSLIPNANRVGPIFVPTSSLRHPSTNQPLLPFPNGGFVPNFTWLPPVTSPRDDPLTAPLLSRLLYPQYHANAQGMPGSSEEGPNQSNN